MTIQIKELDKKDYDIARQFAIEGMDIRRYTEVPREIYLYSTYFFYMELIKATQVLAAYEEDKLVGVLMVKLNNEPLKVNSIWYRILVNSLSYLLGIIFRGGANVYDETNEEMLNDFKKNNNPDGELGFFAVDPTMQGKGIGTLLLNELQKIEKGKQIYLFTDSGCNYQFYDHRDFIKEYVREITLDLHGKLTPLTCFLYSKVL
ncbi:N-acetyltransferase GCN5 [Neocallimastix lanati (nom. inval.)]|jgi:ribosomal protein S18 acetylase RimI-like enzyme|uniref:N-acetyltransferase GCN5 n=1 Tax=Neocallimastix californiae TaxID=1754190 RepID=A0A1Y2A1J8_9FUNG|nr:N-acetyltransferase GCN5 [Neocallimastix sp. JGI-2020a]ORY16338.1 N-acetyltransferase GCN5 [Neocallimastix californiae]|eukprot:ORY16338.1 N-acetyltransferase GCN5 [Neocallimastix californiae]